MVDQSKICNKCRIEKPLDKFKKDKTCSKGIGNICKECHNIVARLYRLNNPVKFNNSQKKYLEKNRDKRNKHQKEYYLNNKNDINKRNKKYRETEKYKKWKNKYKDDNRENKNMWLKDYRKDPCNAMVAKLRCRIRAAVKNKANKAMHTKELINCSVKHLMNHLQGTAIKNGYNNFDINNYSGKEYHIDHIIPCDAFNLKCLYHQRLCFHWSNLQILKAEKNLFKSDMVDFSLVDKVINESV